MTTVEEDDEEKNRLVIDEEYIQPDEPDGANSGNLNATDNQTSQNTENHTIPIANNTQTARNNAQIPPSNIVGLMKHFNLENFRTNHPNIFNNNANEEFHKNIHDVDVTEKEGQIKSNGARVSCKDFARIPFDNGSNLISPEFFENSELYAHLTGRVNTATRSLDNPVHSKAIPRSNEGFQATANNDVNNSRHLHASDTFIPAPSSYIYSPVPNTVYGKQHPQSGSLNLNTSEVRTSIPPNANLYGVRYENTATSMPARNGSVIVPYPGRPSSSAHKAEVLPNANGPNPSMTNNIKTAMDMYGYGPTPIAPRQNREMHALDANRTQMYGQNLTASLASYDVNMAHCRNPCCSGPRKPINMGIPRPALPSFQNPRMPACEYTGPSNVQIPLYPSAQPNVPMQPNQTTDTRNRYAQACNGNGAIPRDVLYRVEDPITYATYEQAYLAALRRKSIAAELSVNEKQKTNAVKAKRTRNTTHLGNEAIINVNPTSSASHLDTTTNFNTSSNMIPKWEAFGTKETVNKSRAKTSKKTKKAKTIAASNAHCAKAPLNMKNYLQQNSVNIEATQADNNITNTARLPLKADAHLQRQAMEMRIPSEYGEITVAYMTNASSSIQQSITTMKTNKPQVPVNPEQFKESYTITKERALIPGNMKTNLHQTTSNVQSQKSEHMKIHTIEQIIGDTIDKAMQSNVLQAGINKGIERDQPSIEKKACIGQNSIQQVQASTNAAPISNSVVQATSKAPELRAPDPFTGVESIRDYIEKTDPISNSSAISELKMQADIQQNIISMNINEVRAPNTKSENAQFALITEASLQQAEMSMNTVKTQVSMKMQTSVQEPKMATNSKIVQTSMKTEACVQQDILNTNIETIPQISKPVKQANNASELEMRTCSIAAKSLAHHIESNAATDFGIKAGTPISIEQPQINNNANPNIPFTMNAHLNRAGMHVNTQPVIIDTIDLTLQTNVQPSKISKVAKRIQTSMGTEEACIQPICMKKNAESALPSLITNNHEVQIKPQNFNAATHASNSCEIEVCTSSTTTESTKHYVDSINLQERPNNLNIEGDSQMEVSTQQDNSINNKNNENAQIPFFMEDTPQQGNIKMNVAKVQCGETMQTSVQQTRGDTSESVQTSMSIKTCTHQAGSNTYIDNLLPLTTSNSYGNRNTVRKTDKPLVYASSNVCKLNMPTSFTTAESIKNNLERSDFVPNAVLLNTNTHTSDILENITQKQVMIQHQEIKDPVDHISIDFLRSVLYNVHRNSTFHNNQANNKTAHCNVDTKGNITKTISDVCNQTLENKYATVSEGNIINSESKKMIDFEKENLKSARQRLALWSQQNENKDVQSNSVEDETQKNIAPDYDSLISLVLNKANILQNITTPHDIIPVEMMEFKDKNSYKTNKEPKNEKNNHSNSPNQNQTAVTKKRKYQNDCEINEIDDSEETETSEKGNRQTHDDKEKPNDSDCDLYRAVIEHKTKVAAKLRQAAVAINKENNKEIGKETNKTSEEEELSIDEFLFFQFQIQFFGRLRAHLADNDLEESADNLSYDIYNLIYISENLDATADMEFKCPNCQYVSIYSPRLFYYKGEDRNLQKSDEIANCEICIGIRKQYIISLRKYILRNKSQSNTLKENIEGKTTTTSSEKNTKTDDITIHSNNDYQSQSTYSDSCFHMGKEDAESAISIDAEPPKNIKTSINDKKDNDKNKNHEIRANIRADTVPTSKAKNNKANNDDIQKNRDFWKIISAKAIAERHNEAELSKKYDKEKKNEQDGRIEDINNCSRGENNSNEIDGRINKHFDDYDPLEEQLNMITNGASTHSKTDIGDKQKRHDKKKMLVKLPLYKLKLSTVESVIKNRNVLLNEIEFTLNNASINTNDNDKNHKGNTDVQKMLSAITVTNTYKEQCDNNKKDHEKGDMNSAVAVTSTNNNPKPFKRNISTATNKKDYKNKNNQNNQKVKIYSSCETLTSKNTDPRNRNINIATCDNDGNNMNNEKGLKVRTLIGVETPTNINAELFNRNGSTTTNKNSDIVNNNEKSHKKSINDKNAISTNVKTHNRNRSGNNDKNYKVRSSICAESATTTSEDPSDGNKNAKIDIGEVNNKKRELKRCVDAESATITKSDSKNKKRRKVAKCVCVETATNINAESHNKNTIENTNDYNKHNKNTRNVINVINTKIATTKNGDPRNGFVNTAINDSSDNNKSIEKNRLCKEGAENTININAKSRKENINDKNDTDKNHKVRKIIHADTATSPNLQRVPKNNKANNNDIQKNRDVKKSNSAETLLNTRQSSVIYSVMMGKDATITIRKVGAGHNQVEARGTNDTEKENDNQGRENEDDNDNSSKDDNENDDNSNEDNKSSNEDDKESDDNTSSNGNDKEGDDSSNNEDGKENDNNSSNNEDVYESDDNNSNDKNDNESDDEANQTARKVIEDAFNSLKKNINSKTELPQVHIPGKPKSKKNTEPKAFKRKLKLRYSYDCHKCTASFKYLGYYYKHMRNHGIYTEKVPKDCVFKECRYCGQEVQKKYYNSHIQNSHIKKFTKKYNQAVSHTLSHERKPVSSNEPDSDE